MTQSTHNAVDLGLNDSRTWIKICGITREQDAEFASQMNVNAIGLVFYAPSSRNVEFEQALRIKACLADSVSSIAVVVDPDDGLLHGILDKVGVDCIQFHGNETPKRCREVGIPYIKALRVRSTQQIFDLAEQHDNAAGFLLDAYESDRVGGTGNTFNWDLIPPLEAPVIVAGGLNPDNITAAMRRVKPSGVDVSTGVESSAGIKDHEAIRQFVNQVRNKDTHSTVIGQGDAA